MREAVALPPIRAGLVKCALAAGFALLSLPAQAQVRCAPAEIVAEFLKDNGLKKTASAPLMDGDELEAWEKDDLIIVVILVKDQASPARCMVRELPIRRTSQES